MKARSGSILALWRDPSNILLAAILFLLWRDAAADVISLLLIVLLLYTSWIVVSVWNCSHRVRVENYYGVLARWLTIAWAANTILFVAFLSLDLLDGMHKHYSHMT